MRVVARQIVGYDPETDCAIFEHSIPPTKWGDVLSLVPQNGNDPEHFYNYELHISVASKILGIIGQHAVRSLAYVLKCERRA